MEKRIHDLLPGQQPADSPAPGAIRAPISGPGNTGEPKAFPVSRFASWLDVKRQTVETYLSRVQSDGVGQVKGQETKLYSVARLPKAHQERLAEAARQGG